MRKNQTLEVGKLIRSMSFSNGFTSVSSKGEGDSFGRDLHIVPNSSLAQIIEIDPEELTILLDKQIRFIHFANFRFWEVIS